MAYSEKPVILVVEDSRVLSKVIEQRLSPYFRVEMLSTAKRPSAMIESTALFRHAAGSGAPKGGRFRSAPAPAQNGHSAFPWSSPPPSRARPWNRTWLDLRVEAIFSKPLDFGILVDVLQQAISKSSIALLEEAETNMATGKKYPFRLARKGCFICGYDEVAVFQPVKEGYSEDWSRGLLPAIPEPQRL